MQDISQILRCNSALVDEHLVAMYDILSKIIASGWLKLAKEGCYLAQEIFQTVQCTTRPVSI
jgi:hypothetical protein